MSTLVNVGSITCGTRFRTRLSFCDASTRAFPAGLIAAPAAFCTIVVTCPSAFVSSPVTATRVPLAVAFADITIVAVPAPETIVVPGGMPVPFTVMPFAQFDVGVTAVRFALPLVVVAVPVAAPG
jgi:hypothetical protein